jgi:hypothetical protein
MLLTQQFHDFVIPAGLSRTVTKNLALLADATKHRARLRAGRIKERGRS